MPIVTSKDGTTIAYDKVGQGPAVILVGGAFNSRAFGPNAGLTPLLAEDFTVFNYDRRGRGGSSDTAPYAIEREIEDINALIEVAGGEVYLYGISSGAALALEAANKLGRKIKKLAVFEAPFVVDDSRPPLPTDFADQLAALVRAGRLAAVIDYFMTQGVGLPRAFVWMMRLMPAWAKLKAIAPTAPYDAACLRNNGAGKPLDAAQWAGVTMPALVMVGGKSKAWMLNAMEALADVLPNARHYVLEDQMHILNPKAAAPILTEFFKTKE